MSDVLRVIGDIVEIQNKFKVNLLGDLLSKGQFYTSERYIVERGGKEIKNDVAIEELKTIAKACRTVGLIVKENSEDSIREYGYHSGSWDVRAYSITIRFPKSPAHEVLYGD